MHYDDFCSNNKLCGFICSIVANEENGFYYNTMETERYFK